MALVNIEAEAKVLNAMANYPDCLDIGIADLKKDHFTEPMHRVVFDLIADMYSKSEAVTMVTVAEKAGKVLSGKRQSWLFVKDTFSSGAEMNFYAKELQKCLAARKISKVAKDIVDGLNNGIDVKDVIEKAQSDSCSISDESQELKVITPKEFALGMYDALCTPLDADSEGMKTGFEKLDAITNGGLHLQELIILAAATGKGKTASTMNIVKTITVDNKIPALYINTEMGEQQMYNRWGTIASDNSRITYKKCAMREFEGNDYDVLNKTCEKFMNSGFYSANIPDLNIGDISLLAKRMKVQHDIKLLVVDYIQRLDFNADQKEHEQLLAIAKRLKNLSQKLGIAIIMLAQVFDDGKLQGSQKMKNEVDLFIELREMNEEEESSCGEDGIYNYVFDITKNRNGACGLIRLHFAGKYMRFYGEEKIEEIKRIRQ